MKKSNQKLFNAYIYLHNSLVTQKNNFLDGTCWGNGVDIFNF